MVNEFKKSELARAGVIALILTVLAFSMSYFAKPRTVSLITKIVPADFATLPNATSTQLFERISKSSGLALVLVISEYSQSNVAALESLRTWALEHFQQEPGFLQITQSISLPEPPQNIFGAFCENLFAGPRAFLEDKVMWFALKRVIQFHNTAAYTSIRNDFYDSFGRDKQSAILLASYEFERARQSVPVLLAFLFWVILFIAGIYRWFYVHKGLRDKEQKTLSGFWIVLSIFYLVQSWIDNSVPFMLSALFSLLIGIYLRRPVRWVRDADKQISFKLITLGAKTLALFWFITFSLVVIQILVWIKTGTLFRPDPISYIIFGLTGNYFHDHLLLKRALVRLIGLAWLFGLLASVRLLSFEKEPDLEDPENFDSLRTSP